jgi:parallel beta-helix repeat protein
MIPVWRCALLGLALAAAVPAQLAGSYSIDNTAPTAGSNFNTFAAATATLAAQGVSGPVFFVVVNTGTPYAGWSIPSFIPGSSATNAITFLGLAYPVISGAAPGYANGIHLGGTTVTAIGTSHVILDGLEVTGVPSGSAISIGGCTNVVVRNCRAHTCGSGIAITAGSGNTVEDCEVWAVGNTVGAPGSATYSGAISVYYNAANMVIQRNKVRDCTGNGIFLGSSGSATHCPNATIINNMIWNTPGMGTYPGGLAIRRSGGSVIAYNSIWMPAGSTMGGIHLMGTSTVDPQPNEISNNILRHDGTGACFRFESGTVIVPAVFDYNLYHAGPSAGIGGIGATLVTSLAAWQATTAPAISGKEVNTLAGPAGFIAANDLHILPGSLGFNSGSQVGMIATDIDLEPRPQGGVPDRGADEAPAMGLFAGFLASPLSGPAGTTVFFTDLSVSSAPGGVTGWAWDFQNDGVVDSNLQNPSFSYPCPGTYTVALTVTDGVNPPNTRIQANYISISNFVYSTVTSGGGTGDLVLTPIPTLCGQAAGAARGWTLASLATANPVGTGPFFGLVPDAVTFQFLFFPPMVNGGIHFIVAPGAYPNTGPINFPPGYFSGLAGQSLDSVMVFVAANGAFVYASNVSRVTF